MKLAFETITNLRRPAFRFPFTVSPSGRWMACTLPAVRPTGLSPGVSSDVAGSVQWLFDLTNNRGIPIVTEPGRSSWSGIWSPVEDTLAFYCDLGGEAGLWLWRENRDIMRLTRHVVRPFFGFESPVWSSDGRYLIVKVMPLEGIDDSGFGFPAGDNFCVKAPISVYKTFKADGSSSGQPSETWLSRYRAELARIDSVTEESQIIAEGFHPLGVAVSQDGTLLVFANAAGLQKNAAHQQMAYDLWVAPIQTASDGTPRCIAKNVYLEGPTFTWYDERTIAYTTAGALADGALWAVHIDGKSAPYPIALSEQVKFNRYLDPPMILANGDVLLVAKGGLWRMIRETGELVHVIQDWDRQIIAILPMDRSGIENHEHPNVIVQTREPKKERNGFYRLDLSKGLKELLHEEPRKHFPWYMGGTAYSKTAYKEKIIYAAESENEPPTLYSLDLHTKEVQKIGDLNPEICPESLGSVRTVVWKFGDRKRKGILMLPAGHSGELVPVIVKGGSWHSKKRSGTIITAILPIRPCLSLMILMQLSFYFKGQVIRFVLLQELATMIKGFGGILWRSKNPEVVKKWYSEVLKLEIESWNGTVIKPQQGNETIFSFFIEDDRYFPTEQQVMLNFQVHNLDETIQHLEQMGVPLAKNKESSEFGTFIWIEDPEGRLIELLEK